jgi:hypothetical protein
MIEFEDLVRIFNLMIKEPAYIRSFNKTIIKYDLCGILVIQRLCNGNCIQLQYHSDYILEVELNRGTSETSNELDILDELWDKLDKSILKFTCQILKRDLTEYENISGTVGSSSNCGSNTGDTI